MTTGPPGGAGDKSTTTVVRHATRCAHCDAELRVGDRYCEACGRDARAPATEPRRVVLVVRADRAAWMRFAGGQVPFPKDVAECVEELEAAELVVGRTDPERGLRPEVDVGELTGDPGVSRRHAKLERASDGAWTITDLDSANGTWRNDDADPLVAGSPAPFAVGDRVYVGAYSVLELRSS